MIIWVKYCNIDFYNLLFGGHDYAFASGQILESDKDFELAIKHKVNVHVSQQNVRQRPITTIRAYNEKSFTLSDGKCFLRSVHVVRTLTDDERLPHLMNS